MLVSEKLAIAAHLHVLLRRRTGRVTDTEWMAQNLEYAQEIVRFARAKAVEDGSPDLSEWADKLEHAVLGRGPASPRPMAQTAGQLRAGRPAQAPSAADAAALSGPANSPSPSTFADTGFADSTADGKPPPKAGDLKLPRYIGGIR
jgi:hypothetical protein